MGDGEKMGKSKKRKEYSLKKIVLMVFACSSLLCLLLIIFVTRISMKAMRESKMETSLKATLEEVNQGFESEYNVLLRLSQTMTSNGLVGEKYDAYRTAEEQYDKILEYQDFYQTLNVATWEMEDVMLGAYLIQGESREMTPEILFSTYSTKKETFQPETLSKLVDTGEVTYHSIHQSYNSVRNDNVVSMGRRTSFSDGTDAWIYLEAKSDEALMLQKRSELEKIPYVLLQLNPEKKVEYSSEKTFAKGDILELDEDGRIEQNGYEGVAKKNIYGFYTVLLLPTYEYQSEIYQWTLLTGSVIFISLAILAVVAISQIWLVSHPIKVLEKEMRHFGKGDFSEAETPVQLAEYNQLFATFNQMKAQIQELIESEQRKEKEKADLELGKLMYQINPHFLMNALNSIHWMALTNHQKEIDDYVKHLGFILSYSLGKAEQNTTLRTELKYLQYYLELQQMTHDFSSEFDIAEGEYLNTRCARFLLQPIAENAVCHNMDEFGTLWVEASEQDRIITIRIRDDGKGFEISEKMEQNAKDERKGIGLRYVQMTLKSFYGEEAEMKIESELGKGTEVTLHFPVLPA